MDYSETTLDGRVVTVRAATFRERIETRLAGQSEKRYVVADKGDYILGLDSSNHLVVKAEDAPLYGRNDSPSANAIAIAQSVVRHIDRRYLVMEMRYPGGTKTRHQRCRVV